MILQQYPSQSATSQPKLTLRSILRLALISLQFLGILAVSNLKKSTLFLDVLLASLMAIWIIVIPMMSYISKLLIEFKIQFYIGEQASRLLIVTSY